MEGRRALAVAGALALCLLAVVLVGVWAPAGEPGTYDRATVTVYDANGTRLATVDVRIADTPEKRVTGLREAETLADGEGMLFVHATDGRKPYVMPPEMSVPLDIVFLAPDGTIRTIRHASVPESDTTLEYPGRGKYVLEVPRGYTNRTGIDPGDRVAIPEAHAEPVG